MNDKTKIIHFVNQLHMAVLEDIYTEKAEDCKNFLDKVHSRLKTAYPYAICFSKLNDNAAQWERYAGNAHGVCIVFNTSAFLNLIYYSGAIFTKVFYQYNIKDDIIKLPMFKTNQFYKTAPLPYDEAGPIRKEAFEKMNKLKEPF